MLDFTSNCKMAQVNNDSNQAGLEPLVQQVEEVAGIMKENRDKVLEREGKLSDLDDRANNLHAAATKFNTNAKEVKKKMWWENVKTKICIGVSSFIIVILIIIIILHQLGLLSSSSDGSEASDPVVNTSSNSVPATQPPSNE